MSHKLDIIFQADTFGDLEKRIQDLNVHVPPRAQGRTTDHCEKWQIHHLLHALLHNHQLPLPVRLYKCEAPDFVFETGKMRIGVETTEAINPDYVKAQMHPAAQQDGAVVDASLYKWGTEGRPASQIREEAGRKRLSGKPWMGESVEREFGQSVIDVVWRKHDKLCSHYKRYDHDRLLVYHNQSSPAIDIDKARAYAAEQIGDYWRQAEAGFDTIYVHKFDWMLYFTRETSGILHEFPRSDVPLDMDTHAWGRLESVEKLYLESLEQESDVVRTLPLSPCEPETDDLLVLENVRQQWFEKRIRDFKQRGCEHLLQPLEQDRLKTASQVAACPSALELLRDGVLRHVLCTVAAVAAGEGAKEIVRLHTAVDERPPEFKASVLAILHYLSFDHTTHWARDSCASSTILETFDTGLTRTHRPQ